MPTEDAIPQSSDKKRAETVDGRWDTNAAQFFPRDAKVGCSGWSIPREHAALFSGNGAQLERYSRRLPVVEINSSFYRPHRAATYARWAAATPDDFRFAVKMPREVTHNCKLGQEAIGPLDRFLLECGALGTKLGPLLVQLPPSLIFDRARAIAFFDLLRARFASSVACEPRHPSWFEAEADRAMERFHVARVASDPAICPAATRPGGWPGLIYYRLHGSPRMYYSGYSDLFLAAQAAALASAMEKSVEAWCIFDNTAAGAATTDALAVIEKLHGP